MSILENKIPPPVITLLFAVLMWGISFITPNLTFSLALRLPLSLLIVVLGSFFCVAGVASFKKATTTVNPLKPEAASSLVNSGIYRISRNPMYVGFALFLLSWGVYLSSPWTILVIVGFVFYMNKFQIIPEERALTTIFGSEFTSYLSQVRRWL
ncbi:isoprenylcysteine carboxylmethyltransferase family protein [Moritella viscosa]|uniref:Membrane protein, putative n=1 Tax=Moritella viscosa TaxID=80854 RepID=A0ABY1HJP9_9GAMM|nr:membrane protein [Moritella viscosa]SGY89242.1 Membrane protein, putative [Moritella viscosa]SGY89278.1 Membrane protein, putative [Moritella viscosa]SGY91844.1 Membrane protein, putative [Moritella viscosa]SGZ02952.1 Membrane protein, putative [Moritella viscosa]